MTPIPITFFLISLLSCLINRATKPAISHSMVIFHCTVHNAASPADNKEHTEGMWHYVFVIFHSTKHTSFSLGSYQCKNAENKLLLVLTLRMMHSWSGDFLPILRLPFASTTKACQFDTSPCQPLRRQCKAAPSAASLTQLTRILWMLRV